jgi:hypothetical protein
MHSAQAESNASSAARNSVRVSNNALPPLARTVGNQKRCNLTARPCHGVALGHA